MELIHEASRPGQPETLDQFIVSHPEYFFEHPVESGLVNPNNLLIGTNSVYADLGGMVVVENFDGRPSLDYQGLSYSVYDRKAQCWKQTWVDSEGSYLDFAGSFENGVMELRRIGEVDGAPALFRMRWENIEPNSFDWSWQRSGDDGETWESLWEIEYSRVL